ncbi:MAG: hypothetical protein WA817_21580 [Candidatus Acidiferrum sp.]
MKRTPMLLFTIAILLLIWYFAGGKEEIQWQLVTRRQAAAAGWDLSLIDRYPHYSVLYCLSELGLLICVAIGLIRITVLGIQRIGKR